MQDNIEIFLKNHLATDFIGKKIYYYTSVSSTMEIARKMAKEADEGTVIIADKQLSGKGRLGRSWLSPGDNLAISIILHPHLENLSKLIMIASIAVVRAIKVVAGLDAQIKWPNDVMIRGKKICGILIENEIRGSKVNYSIIGIGLNINLSPLAFPEISAVATSLSCVLGREISRPELTCVLLHDLEKLYLQSQSGNSVYREWREHMETIGKMIAVQSGETVMQGKAEAVTENGNLILRHSDGSKSEILSGDVTMLKE